MTKTNSILETNKKHLENAKRQLKKELAKNESKQNHEKVASLRHFITAQMKVVRLFSEEKLQLTK